MAGKICNARGQLPGDSRPLINQSERAYYRSHIISKKFRTLRNVGRFYFQTLILSEIKIGQVISSWHARLRFSTLCVFALSFDWMKELLASFVISQCNNFGLALRHSIENCSKTLTHPLEVTPPKDLWFQDCQRRVTCLSLRYSSSRKWSFSLSRDRACICVSKAEHCSASHTSRAVCDNTSKSSYWNVNDLTNKLIEPKSRARQLTIWGFQIIQAEQIQKGREFTIWSIQKGRENL